MGRSVSETLYPGPPCSCVWTNHIAVQPEIPSEPLLRASSESSFLSTFCGFLVCFLSVIIILANLCNPAATSLPHGSCDSFSNVKWIGFSTSNPSSVAEQGPCSAFSGKLTRVPLPNLNPPCGLIPWVSAIPHTCYLCSGFALNVSSLFVKIQTLFECGGTTPSNPALGR